MSHGLTLKTDYRLTGFSSLALARILRRVANGLGWECMISPEPIGFIPVCGFLESYRLDVWSYLGCGHVGQTYRSSKACASSQAHGSPFSIRPVGPSRQQLTPLQRRLIDSLWLPGDQASNCTTAMLLPVDDSTGYLIGDGLMKRQNITDATNSNNTNSTDSNYPSPWLDQYLHPHQETLEVR